jgi:ABC-type uncharacterized transport system permease subunit
MNSATVVSSEKLVPSSPIIVGSALIKVSFLDRITNISDLLLGGLLHLLRLVIFGSVYSLLLRGNHDSFISAFCAIAFAQTVLSIERPLLCTRIGEEIRDDTISMHFLKPTNYLFQSVATYIGRSLPTFLVNMFFSIGALIVVLGHFPLNGTLSIWALILLVNGFVLNILINAFFGILGFWTHDTSGFAFLNEKMMLLFGGLIVPLVFLPQIVQDVALFAPWTIASAQPAKVLTHYSENDLLKVLIFQLLWIIGTWAISSYLLMRGSRRLFRAGDL